MAGRTMQNPGDESMISNIELTNQLSYLLDKERNERLESQLPPDTSPSNIIANILSPSSVVITSSPSTLIRQSQQGPALGYLRIGFGQCGITCERPGRDYVVKLARPAYKQGLWADFQAHFMVREASQQKANKNAECRVPRLFSWIPESKTKWWDKNRFLFPEISGLLPLPTPALVTEHILPLPKIARQALIERYCPPGLQANVSADPTNRDCLARLYLGSRRQRPELLSPNFTLRNFNLHLDQMLEMELPVLLFASAMGEALAIIHWAAHVDGYDIEFVLGSEADAYSVYNQDIAVSLKLTPQQVLGMSSHEDLDAKLRTNFKQRSTRMWVLDFNLCHIWPEEIALSEPDGLVSHLVQAFFDNDPYYPRPHGEGDIERELWDAFATTYSQKAEQILQDKDKRLVDLPSRFINACISYVK
ncbi:zinc finger protein-domain-containing protein [Penicillium cataractarum]|uniref:Zinc finger protein-domain-containing protein n=1 Tax=Penicillium cataractarum TaxID=2100454 RepID=A0A9W9SP79_9EURO|nr:zinc finger protein-domain-containing protein [Penicillium cataractarum]KAJ5381947.1 zinc finger protein-domain-containing protein [Penicillium cataractarum]